MVQFVSDVLLDMYFKVGSRVACIVALCALVRFLPTVNQGVPLQSTILSKWLVALRTCVFDPNVGLLVLGKAILSCKCLWTRVTRYLFWHFQFNQVLLLLVISSDWYNGEQKTTLPFTQILIVLFWDMDYYWADTKMRGQKTFIVVSALFQAFVDWLKKILFSR